MRYCPKLKFLPHSVDSETSWVTRPKYKNKKNNNKTQNKTKLVCYCTACSYIVSPIHVDSY